MVFVCLLEAESCYVALASLVLSVEPWTALNLAVLWSLSLESWDYRQAKPHSLRAGIIMTAIVVTRSMTLFYSKWNILVLTQFKKRSTLQGLCCVPTEMDGGGGGLQLTERKVHQAISLLLCCRVWPSHLDESVTLSSRAYNCHQQLWLDLGLRDFRFLYTELPSGVGLPDSEFFSGNCIRRWSWLHVHVMGNNKSSATMFIVLESSFYGSIWRQDSLSSIFKKSTKVSPSRRLEEGLEEVFIPQHLTTNGSQ